jgi:hypothetical protein
MKKILLMLLPVVIAVFIILGLLPRTVTIVVMGDGPDIDYRILVEGVERARIRKGEIVKLKLEKGEKALEIAAGNIVIDSAKSSRKVVFYLPPVQDPILDYKYEGDELKVWISDQGPYPVVWYANGLDHFPVKTNIPSSVIVEGFIEGKKVFEKEYPFSKIIGVKAVYDGNTLVFQPKLSGFFKPSHYEVSGIPSTDLLFKASSLPSEIDLHPVFGDVVYDGTVVHIPKIPDVSFKNDILTVKGFGFTLNGSPVEGNVELSEGTNVLEWKYENDFFKFTRVWKIFIDKTPPLIDVKWDRSGSSLTVEVKLNEWGKVTLKNGPVVLRDEGKRMYFKLRRLIGDTIEITAEDKFGNTAVKVIDLSEVKE